MVWQIVHDLDIEAAKKTPLTSRTTFIEFKGQINKEVIEQSRLKCTPENMDDFEKRFETVRAAASAQSPRLDILKYLFGGYKKSYGQRSRGS